MENKTGAATPAISLPKGGGAIKGIGETFQPNLFTGTGNFSIPIATSPGRAGFGPQLTLQYSTGNGNGPFGLGWQLSIPRITRKTEKGLPKYDDSDVFVLSGAEDLVPCLKEIDDPDHPGQTKCVPEDPIARGDYTVTRYRPRTEGLFARIERWVRNDDGDVHWRATTKENVTSIYGRTDAARIVDPETKDKPPSEQHVFAWLLQETFDAKGNHILYEYAKEAPDVDRDRIYEENRSYESQRYIRRIHYGNAPKNLDPAELVGPEREGIDHQDHLSLVERHYLFEVLFDYGDLRGDPESAYIAPPAEQELTTGDWFIRDDRFSGFRAGFEIRTLRRCKRVLMFHHFKELGGTTLVKSTDFEYETDPHTLLSFLTAASVTGYRWNETDGEIKSASMPPVTFKYSEFKPHEQRYQSVSAGGNDMPPLALNNPDYALVDLFGNGLPDVLHTSSTGFRYWENLGNGTLDRPQSMPQVPAGVTLSQPGVSFADMAGDGQADLLVLSEPFKGFYETTPDGTWETFKRFAALPSFGLSDPNVRLLDLTGDGLSDVLTTRDHHFLWFECLGEEGYAEPQFVERVRDLDKFPDVYFNDPSGRVRLADMTGDGLNDIVLVHNGRVDYWPNLGYGHFGNRITMARSPRLEYNYDPARLFLVDLDGSGCADLVYVDFGQTHFWFNRSGNSWSDEQIIPGTPAVTDSAAIQFADFFGTGTTAAVWSYDYNQQPGGNYKVLDFCGGVKPYLLTEMSNNMGATTRVRYGSSTQHCLEDETNGKAWVTKLPFPVQVVDKVEVIDHISKTKLVTTYKYHHGYFDGREREFRGFGRVDQFDSEIFDDFILPDLHDGDDSFENKTRAYHVPPVETRTWFHTGIYFDQDLLSGGGDPFDYRELTNRYRREFYAGDEQAFELADHDVEVGGTPHEAYRALRGAVLRTEVYAMDDTDKTDKADHPYLVTHNRHWVRQLQPRDGNNHAVYLTTRKESLTYHYERNPDDPRVGHDVTLDIDDFGNVTDSVSIGYPRRVVRPELPEQGELKIVYTKSDFVNRVDEPGFYYVGIPCQTRRYEVTGMAWPQAGQSRPLQPADFAAVIADPQDFLPFEEPQANAATPVKRIIEWTRNYFQQDQAADDLDAGRLAPCEIESLALPYESYQAVLTDDLVRGVYGDYPSGDPRVTEDMLREAGYQRDPTVDGFWWIPSGRQAFKSDGFYLPDRTRDPFGNISSITYDGYCLLIETAVDPLENTVQARNDYRVLQPDRLTDPNGNLSMVAFDALGLVVGTAVQSGDNGHGDSFDQFEPDLSEQQIEDYLSQPYDYGAALLGTATTRIIYDLWAYWRAVDQGLETISPPVAATLAREKHVSDLAGSEIPPIQHSFLYSDGFGREVQTKVQAEPGEVNGNPVEHRWTSTGAKVYNNKGKPVRQFEPFFSDTHQFGIEQRGVSPIIFYDPLERVVCTLHSNHTYEKVVFDPWQQETWDVNDTVALEDPRTDGDVGALFALLDSADYLPTWYTRRKDGVEGPAEQDAAAKALAHADTPTVVHLDTLGRIFLTVEDDGTPEKVKTHLELDIEGNDRVITDPRGIEAFEHDFDLAGRKLSVNSVDAGHRRTLLDVNGQPAYAWDANENIVCTGYDELRRPVDVWVKKRGAADFYLAQKTIYGETAPASAAANHRGQIWKVYDGAGLVENVAYDFKGNLLVVGRTLLEDGKITEPAWAHSTDPVGQPNFDEAAAQGELDTNRSYVVRTAYDALNRVIYSEAPDGTIHEPHYNEANLLDRLSVTHAGSTEDFVTDVAYNARGQRTRIKYNNGVTTEYKYDLDTFRLERIVSYRQGLSNDNPDLQDLKYAYDPVGNITAIRDDAHQVIFNHNNRIEPASGYRYDPLYRLVEATGREHEAMTPCHYQQGDKKQSEFIALTNQPVNNGQALGNYTETYFYDKSGNLTRIHHHNRTLNRQWTRYQEYEPGSNRIICSQGKNQVQNQNTGQDEEILACSFEDYPPSTRQIPHDSNGNIIKLPHLPQMGWDFKNQLVAVQLNVGSNPNRAYYQYDASGQRVRKTVVKNGRTEERIYLGGYEMHSVTNGSGPTLRRDTIHVMDDQERIALIEDEKDPRNSTNIISSRTRYQLTNHLGSAILEVDGSQAAQIISYEEYYPYGGTAYLAGRDWSEVKQKRYRYSGKERDDETGLYYYGARYYAPWLGRWVSTDPAGIVNSYNLYRFVGNNPLAITDLDGLEDVYLPGTETNHLTPESTHQDRVDFAARHGMVYTDPNSEARWEGRNWVGGNLKQIGDPKAFLEAVSPELSKALEKVDNLILTDEIVDETIKEVIDDLMYYGAEAVDLAGGAGFGLLQGITPGLWLMESPNPRSRSFEFGRGVGMIIGAFILGDVGVHLFSVGVGGGFVSIPTVVGAAVGAAIALAGAALVINSGMAIIQGAQVISNSMMMEGPPRTRNVGVERATRKRQLDARTQKSKPKPHKKKSERPVSKKDPRNKVTRQQKNKAGLGTKRETHGGKVDPHFHDQGHDSSVNRHYRRKRARY